MFKGKNVYTGLECHKGVESSLQYLLDLLTHKPTASHNMR